jgi:hypothetical protein
VTIHQALVHAGKTNLAAAALVDVLLDLGCQPTPDADAVADLLARLDEIVAEAAIIRSELGSLPRHLPWTRL